MSEDQKTRRKPWVNWLLFLITIVVVFLIGLFTSSIVERRSESVAKLQIVKDIPEWEPRNEVWGENYPKEYESYRKTLTTDFRSKHFGSQMIDYLEEGE